MYTSSLYEKSLKYINDILDCNGKFLDIAVLNNKFLCNISVMSYNAIKDAIPVCWRNMLKGSEMVDICLELKIKVGELKKNFCDLSSKDIYWNFILNNIETPTSVLKWQDTYPDTVFNWQYIYSIPFIVAQETSLRSLQYMIINRFFPVITHLTNGIRITVAFVIIVK